LQGLDKAETAARFGEDQVFEWRRSYDIPPPPLPLSPSSSPDAVDPRNPAGDARYADLAPDVLPASESLKETVARVLPYWHDVIAPQVLAGRRVLVAAHGNSLRALVMHLDGMTPEAVTKLNIPTGLPLVYTLDARLRPLGHRYLGDPAVAEAKARAVAAQGAARK
jgi:2,3-bisphosphoglycerate-dependent phosphoglycerate mutase